MNRYVILKYTPFTPLFYEQFINYGYNKVQYVEHLRAANYNFFILNHAFMIDLAHKEYGINRFLYSSSDLRHRYLSNESKFMRRVYMRFQGILDQQYPFNRRFPICDQSSFIDIMKPLWIVLSYHSTWLLSLLETWTHWIHVSPLFFALQLFFDECLLQSNPGSSFVCDSNTKVNHMWQQALILVNFIVMGQNWVYVKYELITKTQLRR